MNTAALKRLVKLAAEAEDDDRWWEFADGLLEEVPDGAAAPSGSHRPDESHAELAEVADDILDETGHLYTVDRLRQLRATARAWPPEERDREVEFAVHERLRGTKTKKLLAVYKRRVAADYKRSPGLIGSPRLTRHRVQVYRADDRPPVTWDEQQSRTARSWLRRAETIGELETLRDIFARAVSERRRELNG